MPSALTALDASTGKTLWTRQIAHARSTRDPLSMIYPPIVASGMVYVGTLGGYVYALDGGTGVERWNALANEGSVPAAVADGTLYTSGAGGVSAFDASTGTRRWVTQSAVSGLTSGDGVIFVAASGSVLSLRA